MTQARKAKCRAGTFRETYQCKLCKLEGSIPQLNLHVCPFLGQSEDVITSNAIRRRSGTYTPKNISEDNKGKETQQLIKPEIIGIVVIGDANSGKATAITHLIYNLNQAVRNRFVAVPVAEKEDADAHVPVAVSSTVLETYKSELSEGLTINDSQWNFQTSHKVFTIIDSPSKKQYIDNALSGTSRPQCAVLVFDSTPAGGSCLFEESTHRSLVIAFTLGVKHLICLITKMDTSGYSEEVYETLKQQVLTFVVDGIRFKHQNLQIVLVCSLFGGENLYDMSSKLEWYKGPSVLTVFQNFKPLRHTTEKPLRLPIWEGAADTSVVVGRVESGVIKPGLNLSFAPINSNGKVDWLKDLKTSTEMIEAVPADHVMFKLKHPVDNLQKGFVVSNSKNNPAQESTAFSAQITLTGSHQISQGYLGVLHIHTAVFKAAVSQILAVINPLTGSKIAYNPSLLKTGESGLVRIVPIDQHIVVEKVSQFPELGRFAITNDLDEVVAVGIVTDVEVEERKKQHQLRIKKKVGGGGKNGKK